MVQETQGFGPQHVRKKPRYSASNENGKLLRYIE